MGLSDSEIAQRVEYAAHFTGLSREILQKSPFELSGGQKRRVAIAGVIAMEPQVLILDEPAAGLDPKGKEEILGGLCEYKKIKNNSLVIISHSMEDVARYSDKILALYNGQVLGWGTAREVIRDDLVSTLYGVPVEVCSMQEDRVRVCISKVR
jgi:energy-coupling factor transport system ATP-binding protein